MNVTEQGTREPGRQRHLVVPRTLVFLTNANPVTGAAEVLLLKGAPHKRLWAGKYNGLGGHVEAGEDVHAAAVREVWEEAGVTVEHLTLRGVVNIDAGHDEHGRRPGVMMFVFVGAAAERTLRASAEGAPEWVEIAALRDLPLVDDLYELLPRALSGDFFYGRYSPQPDGALRYEFQSPISNLKSQTRDWGGL
jgi:8-oxo-dGTP diphosphatase